MLGVVKTGEHGCCAGVCGGCRERTPIGGTWEAWREYPVFAGQAGLDGPGAGATLRAHCQLHSTAAFLRTLL